MSAVDRALIAHIERGAFVPGAGQLRRLAAALGVEPAREGELLTHFLQFGFGTPGIPDSYGTAGGLYHYAGTLTSGSPGTAVGAGPSGVTRAGGRTPAAAKAW